jgi:hypothetical protein
MAGVYLRKRIRKHWPHIDPASQHFVQQALMATIVSEPDQKVRKAAGNVVAAVAPLALQSGGGGGGKKKKGAGAAGGGAGWPELTGFLVQCSGASAEHREVAMLLFVCLTETVPDQLRPHFGSLRDLFAVGLQDPESPAVRVAALRACAALVNVAESKAERAAFAEMLPLLLQTASTIMNVDEAAAISSLELVDDFLSDFPASTVTPHVPAVLQFLLLTACTTSIVTAARVKAVDSIQVRCI